MRRLSPGLGGAAALAGALILAGALLFTAAPTFAQEAPADTTRERPEVRPSEPIPLDTLAFGMAAADTIPVLARLFRESEAADRLAAVPSEDRLPRNPRNAAIRAFLIPGWGQLYTGHPLRAVFYAAGEVGFFLLGYEKQQDVLDTRKAIDEARAVFFADTTLPSDPDAREELFRVTPEAVVLFGDLEFHRERRNDWYAYSALSLIFSAVDAYVSAQLDPIDVGADIARRRAWVGLRLSTGGPPGERR